MPLFKNVKPKLNEYVVVAIGTAQALVITRANAEINKILDQLLNSCPPPDVLERLAKTVQAIKPILTQADTQIDRAAKVANSLTPVIAGLTLITELLIKQPTAQVKFNGNPSTFQPVFAQPAFSAIQPPQGKVRKTQERLRWLQDAVMNFSDDAIAINQYIAVTQGILAPVRQKLDQVDALIQACFQNQVLTDEERKGILDNIQGRYQDPVRTQISYRSSSGKDYTIKVIKDPNSPEIAPKRQAIVQDFRGITVLTGPSSFASDPQILIEEIKFRIENQLP
jgi:hypothetical protein